MNKRKILNNYFKDEDLVRIQNSVRALEEEIKGEFKVVIRISKPWHRYRKSPMSLAQNEFIRQKLAYPDSPGMLIYILLSEKIFIFLINDYLRKLIPQSEFFIIANKLREDFQLGYFVNGLINSIDTTKELLIGYIKTKTKKADTQPPSTEVKRTDPEVSFKKVDYNWLWQY